MAVTFEAIESGGVASGNFTLPKPSGLAAGDLLIAILYCEDTGSDWSATNWTKKSSLANGTDRNLTVLVKLADASDVLASDFTFTNPGNEAVAALLRVSGTGFSGADNLVIDIDSDAGDQTPSYAGGVTTFGTNNLLIMATVGTALLTVADYAVANNNPSWTERADTQNNQTEDQTIAVATATYTNAEATGAYSLSFNQSLSHSFGVLIGVGEPVNAAPSITPATAAIEPQTPVGSGAANTSVTVVTTTALANDPIATTPTPRWSNADKSNTSWSNPDKASPPSWTNPDKSTSNWTNPDKTT